MNRTSSRRESPPTLTREQAIAGATSQSIERGEDYAAFGAVVSAVRQGSVLRGEVEGSGYDPYTVVVVFGARGVERAECTCPYDWGGHCKHIVAVLLTWVDSPEVFVEQAPIADLIRALNAATIRDLLARAAVEVPGLDGWLRTRASALAPPRARRRASQQPKAESLEEWSRRLHRSLSQVRGVGDWSDAPELVEPFYRDALALLEGGNPAGALRAMLAIASPLSLQYEDYEGEAEVGQFLEYGLAPLLIRAIAAADLAPDERVDIARELESFDAALDDYGWKPFDGALEALGRAGTS